MKILFAAQRWDYGDRSRGDSFEYTNLYLALRSMTGLETRFFDTLGVFREGGPAEVGTRLRAAIRDQRPDLVFFVLFEDEVPADLLAELRDTPGLVSVNWFCDDHWRFESFSSRYAPLFDAVTTTTRSALPKYEAIGCRDVLLTQWACNHHLYRPVPGEPIPGVTFVGQVHSTREWTVRRLTRAGMDVQTWGAGWPAGRVSQEEMISIFSRSEINLNLSDASTNPRIPRLVRGALGRVWPPGLERLPGGILRQVKGRNFEIPATGGFQLSGHAPGLEDYFEPDEEIVIYKNFPELVEKARRFLVDAGGRRRIAEAGHQRTLACHTYEHRFRNIFSELGFAVA